MQGECDAGVDESPSGPAFSADEAREFLSEEFGAAVLTQLQSSAWKERLAGTESIAAGVEASANDGKGPRCLQALCVCPGWKDTNFQVRP